MGETWLGGTQVSNIEQVCGLLISSADFFPHKKYYFVTQDGSLERSRGGVLGIMMKMKNIRYQQKLIFKKLTGFTNHTSILQ